jgi:HD-GYP domain-containing protein (c-di-GMP phosphodiesterase class II)
MTNDRPYSKAKTIEEAVAEIKKCSGSQFEPELVIIFLSILASNDSA